jgi:two-component system, NarL family, sensor histidine kinase NreB
LQLTEAINKDVDFLASELRPAVLDDLGLAAALQRFLKTWSQQCGLQAELVTSNFSRGQISPEAEVMFYRITQEAANNVVKHAHATRMDVVLDMRQGTMTLVIADDGVGFDASDRRVTDEGYGLLGMRERAALVGATLEIESSHGRGTTIYVRVPAVVRD